MEDIKDIIPLFQFLLPGFVCAWIFYSLTSYARLSTFERIIQALVFTILIQSLTFLVLYFIGLLGYEIQKEKIVVLSIFEALLLGVIFSFLANNDHLHKFLRLFKITKETSYPSEWYSFFLNSNYIVLHLQDGRRIMGWPTEWPSEPNCGHFVLQNSSWLEDDNSEISLTTVDKILIKADDVKIIEKLN